MRIHPVHGVVAVLKVESVERTQMDFQAHGSALFFIVVAKILVDDKGVGQVFMTAADPIVLCGGLPIDTSVRFKRIVIEDFLGEVEIVAQPLGSERVSETERDGWENTIRILVSEFTV